MTQATVANEGAKVVLVIDGKAISMPPEIAQQLSQHLYAKSKQAEEHRDANRIIMDQAIMQRAGMPIGLSSHPLIQQEARKEAQWNTNLRKKMPLHGIEPRSIVGAPSLRKWKGSNANV